MYGFLSITVISMSSLFAIAIIPCLGKTIYNKVMSFLVALAVGTLAGDAFLHLIPHVSTWETYEGLQGQPAFHLATSSLFCWPCIGIVLILNFQSFDIWTKKEKRERMNEWRNFIYTRCFISYKTALHKSRDNKYIINLQ